MENLHAFPYHKPDVVNPFWPNVEELNFERLVASGWHLTPFSYFICKIHSRCNLDCDYCYVYSLADQSWRDQPKLMQLPVVQQTAIRIREHAFNHGLKEISISMHGGEPLLAGPSYVRRFVSIVRDIVGEVADLQFSIQSNGTLITPEIAEFFVERGIQVGISLDGPKEVNDLHRTYRNGKSSYQAVHQGLSLLMEPQYRPCFSGFLCIIHLQADPLAVFNHLLEFEPRGIDFLFPHGNWTTPPPGKYPPFRATPYADWLIPIFDCWYEQNPKRVDIRFFSEIINLLLGGRSSFEAIGINPANLIVIETNGDLEGVDTLKSTFDGATKLTMNVFQNSFDDALRHPNVLARQVGLVALHPICLACKLHKVCGAGYYPHRYEAQTGFRNPSVYCSDLTKLIRHIYKRIKKDIDRLRLADQPAP